MGWLDLLAVVLGTRDKGCYAAKELLGGGSRGQWWGGLVAIKKVECGRHNGAWTARKEH